ncbi:polyphosphate:nucleotide phosphotransferase, PPK2 family [Bosea sp. CRIB-10]|uniref:polyphosphate kinase 2 family protein n=1 Tax=Bosea sp. CRIB-10 TaxID=378404 RepID=UPI0008F3D666|nr:polyphosphate kinase 2 family protein [Bosea sp. CRIB-10]SFC38823.1 polyphosphate:nucleotide phosphotransferase, PPK2 family [Bosea sp. CRIB-10]
MLPDEMVKRFRVTDGDDFKLKRFDPGETCGLTLDKNGASDLLQTGVKRLRDLQERLFAEKRWSVLIVLQAIDTAGKDGTIEHVMSGVNPQGCEVTSFKAPSSLELRHDFLWRTTCALPERGEIGIFNRSYYEEVLVVRVHEELLCKQGLPPKLIGKHVWRDRFESIRDFEKHLARNGTVVLKFFLNLSKDEQRRRLLSRIDEADKHWKFDAGDLAERKHWDDYQDAYQDAIAETATKHAPWHVVPADNKWFTRLIVAATIVDRLEKLDPQFPVVDDEARKVMAKARKELLAEDRGRKR